MLVTLFNFCKRKRDRGLISDTLVVYTDENTLRIAPVEEFAFMEHEPMLEFDQDSLPLVHSEYSLRLKLIRDGTSIESK